jgi:hypothetical protein
MLLLLFACFYPVLGLFASFYTSAKLTYTLLRELGKDCGAVCIPFSIVLGLIFWPFILVWKIITNYIPSLIFVWFTPCLYSKIGEKR